MSKPVRPGLEFSLLALQREPADFWPPVKQTAEGLMIDLDQPTACAA